MHDNTFAGMHSDFLPDPYKMFPLEYSDCGTPRRRMQSARTQDMSCLWVGITAIVIIYLVGEQNRLNRIISSMANPMTDPVKLVAGMFSNVSSKVGLLQTTAKGLSARVQTTVKEISAKLVTTTPVTVDASTKFKALDAGVCQLIDAPETADEPTLEKNYEVFKKFIEDHKTSPAVIVIFAHWCPHCHSLIGDMAANQEEMKKDEVDYLLVNGESVAFKAFKGEDAILDLTHYPQIGCLVDGKVKPVGSLAEAKETTIRETKPTPTVPMEVAPKEPEMFDQLF